MSVNGERILARNIPTQAIYEFDRSTGIAVRYFSSRPVYYTISSVAPLPEDIRQILLKLDEKYREFEYRRAEDPEWECPPDRIASTEDETRALDFTDDFYAAHPLPPP